MDERYGYSLDLETEFSNLLVNASIKILQKLSMDVCGIWVKDDNGDMIPRVYYGLSAGTADYMSAKKSSALLDVIIKSPDNVAVLSSSRLCKALKDEKLKSIIRGEDIRTVMADPVRTGEEIIGFIVVCSKHRAKKIRENDKKFLDSFSRDLAIQISNLNLTYKLKANYFNTINTISYVLEANDKYTYGHSNKVMLHSVDLAALIGLSKNDVMLVRNAALLHDIGKIGVEQAVLRKKEKLNTREFNEIRKHPVIGSNIIRQIEFLRDLSPVIRHHHERFNGGGYPNPELKGDKIPLASRIITVADSYDAMVSPRVYRDKPLTQEEAMDQLKKNSGTQFDPALSKVFIEHIRSSQL